MNLSSWIYSQIFYFIDYNNLLCFEQDFVQRESKEKMFIFLSFYKDLNPFSNL